MDEKKKLIILGVLGAMMLGIGAFTFMPKGEEPAPVTKKEVPEFLKENEAAKEAEKEAPRNPLLAANLASRDPFEVPASMQVPANIESPIRTQLQEPTRRPNNFNVGNVRPVGLGSFGQLGGPQTAELNAQKVGEPEVPFGYTVGGVVVGARPAVVFKDAAGNQRLVMQGGDVDGESTLKVVRMDHVVVVHKGKTLRLKVGG